MTINRKIEVFSAGCALCADTVKLIESLACPSCDVSVLNMQDGPVADRARELGVRSLPAVAVNGVLLDCCHQGVQEQLLRDKTLASLDVATDADRSPES